MAVNIESVTDARDKPYHHGDLRNALVTAGAELAVAGGPDAVGIRAVAARVGVTPTAAYRHFANHQQLLAAVQAEANERLAAAMRVYLRNIPVESRTTDDAVRRLYATGRGYLTFALSEPGLFRMAFDKVMSSNPPQPQPDGPFELLIAALDSLVTTGYMAAADRPAAEFAAWSAVHGLAMLIIEGPLGELGDADREAVIERTLGMVIVGMHTA